MSTPYDTIYGIPSVGGTATGNSDNGSLKHPGDYASAQKVIDFYEHLKDIYDNTHLLHSVINGMPRRPVAPESETRRQCTRCVNTVSQLSVNTSEHVCGH